jgi:hypothetical protein
MSFLIESGGFPVTLVDFYIREQLRNEQIGEPFKRRMDLLQGLIHQAPNRVYFNNQGEMLRAIFFRGEYPYEAYIDIIKPQGEGWEERKQEYLIGGSQKNIEDQIAFQRARFGMKYDLLTQPTAVFEVQEEKDDRTFIHLGNISGEIAVSCRYYETQLFGFTPRFISFGYQEDTKYKPNQMTLLNEPPIGILEYSRRF